MSKALWFSVVILLCSALAAEALTCHKCRRFKIGFGCVSRKSSLYCVAKPGQKCKVVKSFLDGRPEGIITQRCTKSLKECVQKVSHKDVGSVTTTCCDNHNLCNTP